MRLRVGFEFGEYRFVDVLVNWFLEPKKLKKRNPPLFATMVEQFTQEDDE